MSKKELTKLKYVEKYMEGEVKASYCANKLGLSYRHFLRIVRKYREHDAQGLAHGNRGRQGWRKTPPEVEARILQLYQDKYRQFNAEHMAQMLQEQEGITISGQGLRNIFDRNGINREKYRARRKHRTRPRRESAGELVQFDASPHKWLGEDGPSWNLHGAIDDATGEVLGLYFTEEECTEGYLKVLEQVLQNYGRFDIAYTDRHSIFRNQDDKVSLEEELEGRCSRNPLFTEALEHLGIGITLARSPQAKGRIERLWGTCQDRLIAELTIKKVITIEQANRFLESYRIRHNERFKKQAQDVTYNHFIPLSPDDDIHHVLALSRSERKLRKDGTVRFEKQDFTLIDQEGFELNYQSADSKVVRVYRNLQGKLYARHQGKVYSMKAPRIHPKLTKAKFIGADELEQGAPRSIMWRKIRKGIQAKVLA